MSFFPPFEPSETRRPRRPTLRDPEEVTADQALMERFARAMRVRAAAGVYVKILLVVAIGCLALMAYTAVMGAKGQGGWRPYPVFLLATVCALRSLSTAARLSQATGTGHWFLRVNILPRDNGTRIRFFIYETALLLALLIGATTIGH